MFRPPISWEELIRGSAARCNERSDESLVRAKMIGDDKQAREDEQGADDYRNRFWCVV